MASAGPPPLSPDGLWFWDGSGWKSLVKQGWHDKIGGTVVIYR